MMRIRRGVSCLSLFLVLGAVAASAAAGEADVVSVEAVKTGTGVYRFDVTVRHTDEGWDHYADAWDIVGPDRRVLGQRILLHPHENEQPFTRRLSDVRIPPGIRRVIVRARDKVHGYGGRTIALDLSQ